VLNQLFQGDSNPDFSEDLRQHQIVRAQSADKLTWQSLIERRDNIDSIATCGWQPERDGRVRGSAGLN
jgi:hypothetical protein